MFATAPQITSAGSDLIKRAMLGETITFTRFALGDGELDEDADSYEFTDLINSLLDVSISKLESISDEAVAVTGRFYSGDIENDFMWREFGVFCKGEDGVEELFAYANDGEQSGMLKAECSDVTVEQTVRYVIRILGAANVSAEIKTVMYATEEDLKAHVEDTDNPHGVTAAQLGLENVDNTSDANKPVSTKQAAADAAVLSKAEMRDMAFAARLLGWDIYADNINTVNDTYPFNSFGEKTAILYSDYNTSDDLLDTWNLGYNNGGTFYVANLTLNTIMVALPTITTGEAGVAVQNYENVSVPSGSVATINIAWSSSVNMPYGSCTYEDFDPIGDLASKLNEGGVL